eukprot:403341367
MKYSLGGQNNQVNQTQQYDTYSYLSNSGLITKKASPLKISDIKQKQRERDQKEMMKENMKFLERLRNSKGTLDSSNMKEFEEKQNNYLKIITEGPLQFNQGRSSSVIRQHHHLGFGKNSGSNFHSYRQNTSIASKQSYDVKRSIPINKDFSYGLKLPDANNSLLNANNMNDSFDQELLNIANRPSAIQAKTRETEFTDQMSNVKKRYKTRPKQRNNLLINQSQYWGLEIPLHKTKLFCEDIKMYLPNNFMHEDSLQNSQNFKKGIANSQHLQSSKNKKSKNEGPIQIVQTSFDAIDTFNNQIKLDQDNLDDENSIDNNIQAQQYELEQNQNQSDFSQSQNQSREIQGSQIIQNLIE